MAGFTRSADEVLNIVTRNPARLQALKENPLGELEKLREEAVRTVPPAYYGDVWLYRMAVGVLGALALTAAVGSLLVVKPMPEVLVSLGSAAVGALVGLFAPSPMSK